MPEGLTVKCNKCNTELFWPTAGFKLNIIGAVQMQCMKCNQIACMMPTGTQILGLKDEGQEALLSHLFSEDEFPPTSSKKKSDS